MSQDESTVGEDRETSVDDNCQITDEGTKRKMDTSSGDQFSENKQCVRKSQSQTSQVMSFLNNFTTVLQKMKK